MKEEYTQDSRVQTDYIQVINRDNLEDTLDEYEIADRIDDEFRSRQRRHTRRIAVTVAVIVLLLAAVLLVLILQTYDSVQVLETHELSDAGNNGYRPFAGQILKYNRDGVSLMNADGEDKWNQAVQMQQPSASVSGGYAVVADLTGTTVCIFDEKGMTGEIRTTKPIQRAVVGSDGTAAVILENGRTPDVNCYSSDGTLLLRHQASLSGSGYPISAAISDDGTILALSYLRASGSGTSGKTAFFEIREKTKDNMVYSEELEDEAAGEIFFMDSMAAVVAETRCILYEGTEKIKKKKTIKVDGEIEKVFHDQNYFGLIERDSEGNGKLRVYARNGSLKLEKEMPGSYDKVLLADRQVICYSGQESCIYTLRGIHRFEGRMRDNMLFVMPLGGINRYAVITNEGIDTVFLTR